ncbi:MAG TPA: putative metal-binding motif-containing protein [Myxococcaceae bacterium]|nr:putative metal-binding motif-containing protein [Myxococcaceae bacterium]
MRPSIPFCALVMGVALALSGCPQQAPVIRVSVELKGFSQGCVRVLAGPPGAPDPLPSEIELDPAQPKSVVTVAVFPKAEWGTNVEVTAQALEGTCGGPLVAVDRTPVEVKPQLAEAHLTLSASDADGDGFFARPLGTDCNDADSAVHPGAEESCNGRDDNCDGAADEGFEVGLPCPAGTCTGAWACNTDGTRRCEPNVRWYPDQDGDGRGQADAGGTTNCNAPAGRVPNALDCNDADPAVYGGGREVCDGKDNDCSGVADDPFFVGQGCPGTLCEGALACAPDGGSTCAGGEGTVTFPDVDRDGFGASGVAGTRICGAAPDGFSTSSDDCDDGNGRVHPGAVEICDGLDDDCDGQRDEGYPPIGGGCDAGGSCPAAFACLADGGAACVATAYRDADRDRHGSSSGPTFVGGCLLPDSGYLYDSSDCDDQDPFTFQGAPEICDGRDNDCSGTADDGATCPADAGWYAKTDGLGTHDLEVVSTVSPGSAFVAGDGGTLMLVKPTAPTLVDMTPQCGRNDWPAAWFDPVTDNVYLAGAGGFCAVHTRTGTSCPGACILSTSLGNTRGLVGFHNGVLEGTTLDIFGVMDDGQTYVWDGTVVGDDHSLGVVGGKMRAVHGATETRVFAVGSDNGGNEPRIFRYNLANNSWANQGVQNLSGVVHAPLNAIWMASDTLGFAVGEQRSVLSWDGAAWSVRPGPTGGNGSLRGVVVWGPGVVFAADDKIHRFDGTAWTTISPGFGAQIFALGGSSPADLWAVGSGGWMAHWPQPPW